MTETYYQILGVEPDASQDTIKKAYRAAMSACHPDREGGDSERATLLNRIYKVLSNPETRANYDVTGKDEIVPEIDPMTVLKAFYNKALDQEMQESSFASTYMSGERQEQEIYEVVTKAIESTVAKCKKDSYNTKAILEKLRKKLRSIERVDGAEETLFYSIVANRIAEGEQLEKNNQRFLRAYEAARKIWKEEYKAPPGSKKTSSYSPRNFFIENPLCE